MDGRKVASMDVWRDTMQALGEHQALYLQTQKDPAIAKARAGQLEQLTLLGNSVSRADLYSGAYAAKIRQILGQPIDSVSLSPEARSRLGLGASDQFAQRNVQTPESIALMVMKGSMLNVSV